MKARIKIYKFISVVVTTSVFISTRFVFAGNDDGKPKAPDAASERSMEKSALVDASAYDLWWAWTTTEGLASFFAPDSSLDLSIGGTWELYMSKDAPVGQRGSEGCKLLAYVPFEMLCFEWTAPPKVARLRDAGVLTRVMVTIEEIAPNRSVVTITHLGFGDGETWDECHAYFDAAWDYVLNNLKTTFAERGDSLRQRCPMVSNKRWQDGAVTVASHDGKPERWQTFDVELPAPVEQVWDVLATADGMKRFMGGRGEPVIELKAGGKYAVWPAARNTVMTFAKHRMLAVTGSAPDEFPNVQQGGSWGVYSFTPMGKDRTRLRLTSMGWTEQDDEWKKAYEYFLGANAQYMNMLHKHFGGESVGPAALRTLEWSCDLDAPVADVWALFTTKAGVESWMVPIAEVDFRVGGTIKTNYDAAAGIGGPGTITHHILALEPGRMYAARFDAPENAPVKGVAESTWGVTYFEPQGPSRTRLRLVSCGWGHGADWDQAERFFDWGNRVTLHRLIGTVHSSGTDKLSQISGKAAEATRE